MVQVCVLCVCFGCLPSTLCAGSGGGAQIFYELLLQSDVLRSVAIEVYYLTAAASREVPCSLRYPEDVCGYRFEKAVKCGTDPFRPALSPSYKMIGHYSFPDTGDVKLSEKSSTNYENRTSLYRVGTRGRGTVVQ